MEVTYFLWYSSSKRWLDVKTVGFGGQHLDIDEQPHQHDGQLDRPAAVLLQRGRRAGRGCVCTSVFFCMPEIWSHCVAVIPFVRVPHSAALCRCLLQPGGLTGCEWPSLLCSSGLPRGVKPSTALISVNSSQTWGASSLCTSNRVHMFTPLLFSLSDFFFSSSSWCFVSVHIPLVWNNWIELRDGDAGGLWKNVRLQEGTCVCVCLCCHVKHHPHLLHLVRPLLLSSLTVINDPQLSGTLSSSFLFFCFFFSFWLPARDGGTTLQWIRKIKRVKEAVILSLQNREDLSQATRCWKE